MPIDIDQILVFGLFVDGCEMVTSGCKCKVFGSKESHWMSRFLFVSQIPPNNSCIQKRFFATLLFIILPFMRKMSHLEALIVINGRATTFCIYDDKTIRLEVVDETTTTSSFGTLFTYQ